MNSAFSWREEGVFWKRGLFGEKLIVLEILDRTLEISEILETAPDFYWKLDMGLGES